MSIKEEAKAAEGGVLGSMMLSRNNVDQITLDLVADDFAYAEHRFIFNAIVDIAKQVQSEAIDIILIRNWLTQRQLLDAIGGVDYLVAIVSSVPTTANAGYYAKIVKKNSIRRKLLATCQGVIEKCMNQEGEDIDSIVADSIKSIQGLGFTEKTDLVSMDESVNAVYQTYGASFLSSGFNRIDSEIVGLGKGWIVVIAGRPGMGKSSLMGEMAIRISSTGSKVLYVSLEMPHADITRRLICSRSSVQLGRAVRNLLNPDEIELYATAAEEIRSLPIRFYCKTVSPDKLRALILQTKRKQGCDVVFLDHIGLMRPDCKTKGLYETVTLNSNALKQIAMDLEIPIVVGCQLNRMNGTRSDKRPTLSDLRDSGAIEQDADTVMLLHRPWYYDNTEPSELCEVFIAKNRSGPMNVTVNLGFTAVYTRFYEDVI